MPTDSRVLTDEELADYKPVANWQDVLADTRKDIQDAPIANFLADKIVSHADKATRQKQVEEFYGDEPGSHDPTAWNAVTNIPKDVIRNAQSGALNIWGSALGWAGAGAKLVGANDASTWLTQAGKNVNDISEAYPKAQAGYLGTDTLPEYITYAAETFGQQIPQLFGAAKVGQVLGKIATSRGLSAGAVSLAEKAGIAIPTGIQEGGGAYLEALEKGAPNDRWTAFSSIAAGAVNGALETFGATNAAMEAMKSGAAVGRKPFRKFFGDAMKEALKTAGAEGLTEATQESITIANNKVADRTYDFIGELKKPENWNRVVESAVAGALVGFVTGGIGEAYKSRSESQRAASTTSVPPVVPPAQNAAPVMGGKPTTVSPTPTSAAPDASTQTTAKSAPPRQNQLAPSQDAATGGATLSLTPAQRSELEDIRGELEAAQLANDTDRASYLDDVLRMKQREFNNPQPLKANAPQNVQQQGGVPSESPGAVPQRQAQPEAKSGDSIQNPAGGATQVARVVPGPVEAKKPAALKSAAIDADAIAENGLDQPGGYRQETPEFKQSIFRLFLKKAASIGVTDIRRLSTLYSSSGLSGRNGGSSLSAYLTSTDGTNRTLGDNPAEQIAWEFKIGREIIPVTWGDLAAEGIAQKNPDGTIKGSGFTASESPVSQPEKPAPPVSNPKRNRLRGDAAVKAEPAPITKTAPVSSELVVEPEKASGVAAEYDTARRVFSVESKAFTAAQKAYRSKEIGDKEFLAARAKFDAAMGEFDKAETRFIKETNRKAEGKPVKKSEADKQQDNSKSTSLKNVQSNQSASSEVLAGSVESSPDVLWASGAEIERLLTLPGQRGVADNEQIPASGRTTQPGVGGKLHSGTASTSQEVSRGPRVVIEKGAGSGRIYDQQNLQLLASRIVGKTVGPTDASAFNLRLLARMAGLRFVFAGIDGTPKASYRREFDTIFVNTFLLTEDLRNPDTVAAWDKIFSEEILHAVIARVSSNHELSEVWNSLSEEERKAVRNTYDRAGKNVNKLTPSQLGDEYVRMVFQQRLFGRLTEEHETFKFSRKLNDIFNKAIAFIRETFGLQPSSPIARQVIERLEGAIRGEAPLPYPIQTNEQASSPRGTSVKSGTFQYSQVPESTPAPAEVLSVGESYRALAQNPRAFRYPTSQSNDISVIAQEMAPVAGVKANSLMGGHVVELQGKNGSIYINDIKGDGPYIVSTSAGSAGNVDGGGSLLYQIALTWAHNNGKTISPSPDLSEIAILRRTSNMLSSALRFGTTDHMAPDSAQKVDWIPGDTWGNIARLAIREQELVKASAGGLLGQIGYNPQTIRFERPNGVAQTVSGIDRMVQDSPGNVGATAGVGSATLQRAAFTESARARGGVSGESFRRGFVGNPVEAAHLLRLAQSDEAPSILYALSPAKTNGKAPQSLTVKQVNESLFSFGFGGLPPNTETTHRLDITHNGRGVRGWYDPNTGKVWLNAAYITSPEMARATLVEEAFHAVQNDPSIQAAIERIYGSLTLEQVTAARAAYGNVDEATLKYEAVADVLEKETLTNEQRGLVAKLWNAIKDAMTRFFGGLNANWNSVDTDARTIISHALNAAAEGRRTNTSKGTPIYARNAVIVPPGAKQSDLALTAHHGTPHQVDKFSTSKVGTGEGAQVYGWGLYFAENPEVAGKYAEKLGGSWIPNRVLREYFKPGAIVPGYAGLDRVISFNEGKTDGDWSVTVERVERTPSGEYSIQRGERQRTHRTTPSEKELRAIGLEPEKLGRTYTVSLNAEPEDLLDWDKPLSEQSEKVRKALLENGDTAKALLQLDKNGWDNPTGKAIYNEYSSNHWTLKDNDPRAIASRVLANIGIKGIRYLDQGSRMRPWTHPNVVGNPYSNPEIWKDGNIWRVGDRPFNYVSFQNRADAERFFNALEQRGATYNYVIFNENDIKITHANGNPVSIEKAQQEQTGEPMPLLFSLGDPVAPEQENLSKAAVELAANRISEFGRARMAQFDSAAAGLSELAYETASNKTARATLSRLVDMAKSVIQQEPEPNWNRLPDPDKGVEVARELGADGKKTGDGIIHVDRTFTDMLSDIGVPHDKEQVMTLQAELFFEKKAHALVNSRRELASKQELRDYYNSLPENKRETLKENIKELNRSIGQRVRHIDAAEKVIYRNDTQGAATVGQRANAIQEAQDGEIEARAQADARLIPQVVDIFGEPGERRDSLIARIQSILADPSQVSEEVETLRKLIGGKNYADQYASLNENQRQTAIAALAKLFQQFDASRESLSAQRDMAIAKLSKTVRDLKDKIESASTKEGEAQLMLEKLLRDNLGDPSVTHSLETQEQIQQVIDGIESVVHFAKNVAAAKDTNSDLYNRITSGDLSGQGLQDSGILSASGLNPQALENILAVLRKSPDFGSAVGALIRQAAQEHADNPSVSLSEIERIIKEDTEAGKTGDAIGETVAPLIEAMSQQARAAVTAAQAEQRTATRELADITVRLRSLDHALALFDGVAGSSEFNSLRLHVEHSDTSHVEPMKLENRERLTFVAFGKPGTPIQAEVSMNPNGDSNFLINQQWRDRAAAYMETALEYVTQFDYAKAAFDADPKNNPSPESLGFEVPVVRGLRQVLQSDKPMMLQWANTDFSKTMKTVFSQRMLQRADSLGKIFRTVERSVGMLRGVLGTHAAQAVGDYAMGDARAGRILHRFKNIDVLLSAAMRSHAGEGMKLIVEVYENSVFQELAHHAREFGTEVRAGYRLPDSGMVVTAEDMALLHRVRDMFEAARREVEEGGRADRGIRETIGGVEYVRKGASPGDIPLVRHLTQKAMDFAGSLVSSAEKTVEWAKAEIARLGINNAPQFIKDIASGKVSESEFDPAMDFSAGSSNPIVKFWNTHMDSVRRHIIDVGRTDRTMKLDSVMEQAYRTLSRDIRDGNEVFPTTVEELIQKLTSRVPPNSAVFARDHVIRELGAELGQYLSESRDMADTRRQTDTASGIAVTLSSQNAFTKPAALLRLPSNLYTYGALTPGARLLAVRASNHDNAIRAISAIELATKQISAAIAYYNDPRTNIPGQTMEQKEKEAFKEYGGSLEEARQILSANQQVIDDFEKAYQNNDKLINAGFLKKSWNIVTGALLAGPITLINNFRLGTIPVFMAHSAISRFGRIGGAIAVARLWGGQIVKNSAMVMDWATRSGGNYISSASAKWLGTTPGKRWVADMVRWFSRSVLGIDPWGDMETIQRLGLSQRDRFGERVKQAFVELSEYPTLAEYESANKNALTKGVNRIRGLVSASQDAILQFESKVGIEAQDMGINVANLSVVEAEIQHLMRLAMRYGKERERMGLKSFDFNNPDFAVRPDEAFSSRIPAENERQLSILRQVFLKSAGSTGMHLEQNLWNYYQAQKTNPKAKFFTDAQWDAFAYSRLTEWNASNKINRSSYLQSNPLGGEVFKFFGYPANLMGQMVEQYQVARGTPLASQLMNNLATMIIMVAVATVIALQGNAEKEYWKRLMRGETGRNIVWTDDEFWNSPGAAAKATAMATAAAFPFLGSFALNMSDLTQGGKGFDPSGNFVLPSVLTRLFAMARGLYNLPWEDKPIAVEDAMDNLLPYFREMKHLIGRNREGKNAANIGGSVMDSAELLKDNKHNAGTYSPSYGPLTGPKRKLEEDAYKMAQAQRDGNQTAYAEALADAQHQKERIVEYYKESKGFDDAKAQAAAYRDYVDLSPLRKAARGKALTDAEYQVFQNALGDGDRAQQFRSAMQSYETAGQTLFGRAPSETKQAAGGGVESAPDSGNVRQIGSVSQKDVASGAAVSYGAGAGGGTGGTSNRIRTTSGTSGGASRNRLRASSRTTTSRLPAASGRKTAALRSRNVFRRISRAANRLRV